MSLNYLREYLIKIYILNFTTLSVYKMADLLCWEIISSKFSCLTIKQTEELLLRILQSTRNKTISRHFTAYESVIIDMYVELCGFSP